MKKLSAVAAVVAAVVAVSVTLVAQNRAGGGWGPTRNERGAGMKSTLLKKLIFVALGGLVIAWAMNVPLAGQGQGAAPGAPAAVQAPGAPDGRGGGQAPGAPGARGGGRGGTPAPPQGGRGPIKVLVITKGHNFDRDPFFQMWDGLGETITWTHVEHPAADIMMTPQYAKKYDVLAFYDLGGPGGPTTTWDGKPIDGFLASNNRLYPNPSPELKTGFRDLLRAGKGMVFLHHASAAWAHTWPEYSEVIGGACDWYANTKIRGIDMPNHLFAGMTPQHISMVDKTHPIAKGLEDGYDVIDEAYACAWFEDSVHAVGRTDFLPADPVRNLGQNWKYSNLSAWVKVSENSPVFFTQVGHGPSAWINPKYRLLLANAIKWAASPEALAWAKANPTHIFR